MNIKINSIHFVADKKLEDFVESKVDKLIQKHEDVIKAEVFLRLENTQDPENKIAEIKLDVPGIELFAKKQSKSFEEATDSAIEALRRQMKKHKEKLRDK